MTENRFELTIGEVIKSDRGFPQVKLTIKDQDGVEVVKGYLSPFRGYCFQVSANMDGDYDMGSSVCMDFRKMAQHFPYADERRALLQGQALIAVMQFVEYEIIYRKESGETTKKKWTDAVHVPNIASPAGIIDYTRCTEENRRHFLEFLHDTIVYLYGED